jgi:hypothetical protein
MTFKMLADAVDEKLALIAPVLGRIEQGGQSADLRDLVLHLMDALGLFQRNLASKRPLTICTRRLPPLLPTTQLVPSQEYESYASSKRLISAFAAGSRRRPSE